MKSIWLILSICLSAALVVQAADSTEDELLSLQFVFRHGDRTPKSLYKNDPYRHYAWPEGLAALTAQGKERMFHFAKILKQRYAHYIGEW